MGIKHSKQSYSTQEKKPARNSAVKLEKHDYVEDVVCQENDINENEMKLLPLGEDGGKILLIKQKGELHAIGTKCTHYGALLNTGALGDGRVRCPWHGACFNIKTGDIEDYPGLDSLPCYKVTVDKGLVKVQARREDLESNTRVKEIPVARCRALNNQKVVIVGGGPAGATCAETLRQEGFTGDIVLVCKEPVLPYDRIKVSKAFDFNVSKSLLRSQAFFDERRIKTKLNVEATELDTKARVIKLSNGEALEYNYVFLATGSKARMPTVPGSELKNIFTVRNYSDAAAIHQQLASDKNLVVLGQSFIGMEAAACCVGKCASVTVVGRDSIPLRAVFGDEIGTRARQEHEAKGVKFINGTNICKFIPRDEDGDSLGQVELDNGTILPADIVIAGIGSTPYTEWLKGSAIEILEDGTLLVDNNLKTNVEGIYAGGDIACAPVFAAGDHSVAIGHYGLAHYHGRIAALNICGKKTALKAIPYFWTMLFGKGYRYAGHGKATSVKICGSLENFKFFAYHFDKDQVIAMSSVGCDPIVSDFAEYTYEGKTLTRREIEEDPTAWMRNKPMETLKTIFPEKFSAPSDS